MEKNLQKESMEVIGEVDVKTAKHTPMSIWMEFREEEMVLKHVGRWRNNGVEEEVVCTFMCLLSSSSFYRA